MACNDTRDDLQVDYAVRDVDSGEVLAQGRAVAAADRVTVLGSIPFTMGEKHFYVLEWTSALGPGSSHYLAGNPPFDLATYRGWLDKAGLLSAEWLQESGLE